MQPQLVREIEIRVAGERSVRRATFTGRRLTVPLPPGSGL